MKIISGGQSGVDRAALDFALQNKIPCGGWCPKGRLAEDGTIDQKYPLQETRTSIYAERTRLNVDDSDAILIIFDNVPGNGSAFTAEYAKSKNKLLFITILKKPESIKQVQDWLTENDFKILNIAGPRESTSPGIYLKTFGFLEEIFTV